MARSLLARGVDAVTVKLVQTGCAGGVADDLARHRAISGAAPCYEDTLGLTSPQIFAFPASPELAARREGKKVDLRRILMCVQACAAHHDVVLVEGAGGLAVPLADDLLAIDLAARQKWPLILVTSGRLGSINHTLLSLEAAKRRDAATVIMNAANEAAGIFSLFDQCSPERRRKPPTTNSPLSVTANA